jgi:hypothetical protein
MTRTTPAPRRLIDRYAGSFDVTDTVVTAVDAEPAAVAQALEELDPAATITRALAPLGAAGRPAVPPELLESRPGEEYVFGLVWANDGEGSGSVSAALGIAVRPGAADGTTLAATVRFAAEGSAPRERLLDSWGAVGAASRAFVREALRSVKERAEDDEAPVPGRAGPPRFSLPHRAARGGPARLVAVAA